jgi:hypothetical protein
MVSSAHVVSAAAPVIIADVAQLRALQINPKLLAGRALVLDLPWVSAEVGHLAAARIVSYTRECGCSLGAKCMAVSFAVALAGFAFRYGTLTQSFFWRVPLAVLFAFAGAGLGKVYGIARAHRRLHHDIDTLIAFQSGSLPSEV